MASIQRRGASFHVMFHFGGKRHSFAVGKVTPAEAEAVRARVEWVLMRVDQGLLARPKVDEVVEFVRHDGRPPAPDEFRWPAFGEVRDAYLATFDGALEANTLATARIHLAHVAATIGEKAGLDGLDARAVQRHVDRRRKEVAGVTIRKEVDTLRSAWNWALRTGRVRGEFPGSGLVFPKDSDKLPFMTWGEVERRVAAGGDPDELWECLYLTLPETERFVEFVRGRKSPDWFFPMVLFAAHTGARRSEMLRARCEDVDLAAGFATIREKKRVRGRLTTRRVPLSGPLASALAEWMPGRASLFGTGEKARSVQGAQKAFVRAVKGSRWSVLHGWHVLRHSFISTLATRGVDQRLIDEWCGHSTEAMRRRYRHLHPGMQSEAIKGVFG